MSKAGYLPLPAITSNVCGWIKVIGYFQRLDDFASIELEIGWGGGLIWCLDV